jgi:hypothetical protein
MKRQELYNAIVRRYNIDNFELRRVYANEIIEADPARSKFIHLQLDADVLKRNGFSFFHEYKEAKELLSRYKPLWVPKELEGVESVTFLRGFVEMIKVDTSVFLDEARQFYRSAPIRSLHLKGTGEHAERLFSSDYLADLKFLCFDEDNNFTDKELERLSQSTQLSNLRCLLLRWTKVTEKGLEHLARSTNLLNLEYVEFFGSNIDEDFESIGYDGISGHPVSHSVTPFGGRMLDIAMKAGNEIKWINPFERLGNNLSPFDF